MIGRTTDCISNQNISHKRFSPFLNLPNIAGGLPNIAGSANSTVTANQNSLFGRFADTRNTFVSLSNMPLKYDTHTTGCNIPRPTSCSLPNSGIHTDGVQASLKGSLFSPDGYSYSDVHMDMASYVTCCTK